MVGLRCPNNNKSEEEYFSTVEIVLLKHVQVCGWKLSSKGYFIFYFYFFLEISCNVWNIYINIFPYIFPYKYKYKIFRNFM